MSLDDTCSSAKSNGMPCSAALPHYSVVLENAASHFRLPACLPAVVNRSCALWAQLCQPAYVPSCLPALLYCCMQSGRSFANLLQPNGTTTPEQDNRLFFMLTASGKVNDACPPLARLMTRQLPTLGPDRCVTTLNYDWQ
jgi:hypothetical protein